MKLDKIAEQLFGFETKIGVIYNGTKIVFVGEVDEFCYGLVTKIDLKKKRVLMVWYNNGDRSGESTGDGVWYYDDDLISGEFVIE
jgi:hypothetical protein